ncbi:MAG: 16S rRNA (cytidine(1402)-2'-O)-methyltransferase [Oscillospiraceae bacterium]|nr:16S rRNA (cytidine(1402)-2'-O)-methyltransferase [Oscillospiraceae bacterium]
MPDSSIGKLYLVATPIGNLSDISSRAIDTLSNVDFIAAEDTRVTRKLLEHFNIRKPIVSYYQHNTRISGEKILSRITDGESCALVTDAGTPAISDPGEELVRVCADARIPMVIIPGPCAVVAAVALSGLDSSRFTFEGYLPVDKKKRKLHLNELQTETKTMVLYEAPHKLNRTLSDLFDTLGDRRMSISREMTKIYEETLRMPLSEAITHFNHAPPRGEFVLVIEGANIPTNSSGKLDEGIIYTKGLIEQGLTLRDAVKKAADDIGCSRNLLYKTMIDGSK